MRLIAIPLNSPLVEGVAEFEAVTVGVLEAEGETGPKLTTTTLSDAAGD